MSSSKSEDQDQTEILIDDVPHEEKNEVPHGGKKIDKYIVSPNIECIVTLSKEDKSIVVWTVTKTFTKDLIVKYDCSLNFNDLERALNFDSFCKNPDFKFESLFSDYRTLAGISDCKHVIIRVGTNDFEMNFAIIDITTQLRQVLSAQGLEGYIDSIAFLENGDLAIVKGEPVYRAYLFSKSNSSGNHKWNCNNSIELEKSTYLKTCRISKKRKLFMGFSMPFVVTQWDLITRKFDMQYILNWDLIPKNLDNLKIELNGDNTLLAMVCNTLEDNSVVYIYLTKSGMMVANSRYFLCKII
ncbi:11009_t:CDS:2 [Cetraspora pellucida]|uniref:11009_t:CDS:1 n=1 Tax=Cetraspora pellucida TaxID=1433469 RepID=A0ACA9KV43_9GLOM|nr:11009_t:CDS:2 [Cetraspora pellucida]